MNNKKVAITILLLLTSSGVGQKTIQPSAPQSLKSFSEVKGVPEFLPASFQFSASDYKYMISGRGRGRRTGGGTASRSFNLLLDKEFSLDRSIYYTEHEGDVLLVCEVSDQEAGAGFITRLDGQTLRIKWKRAIPGFNVGAGLIEGDYAYLTAIGFVAKVNLKSGVYSWRHTNLYRDDHFNSFELPGVEGDAVLFRELVFHGDPPKTIRVQKWTGKIISIK